MLAFIISWRFAGAWEAYQTGETTMLLGWPLWWSHHHARWRPVSSCSVSTAAYTAWKGVLHSEGGMERRAPKSVSPSAPCTLVLLVLRVHIGMADAARRFHRLYPGGPAGTR